MGVNKALPLLVVAVLVATTVQQQSPNACRLDKKVGTCNEKLKRYYFDLDWLQCREFTYTGCGGNTNRFATYSECETQCKEETNPCRYGQKLADYNCGRSPNRRACPSTHFCKVHPSDRFAVCCPSQVTTTMTPAAPDLMACMQAILKCQTDFGKSINTTGSINMELLCRGTKTLKTCVTNAKYTCNLPQLASTIQQLETSLRTYEAMCSSTGCMTGIQRCMGNITLASGTNQVQYQKLCRNFTGIVSCLNAVRPKCSQTAITGLDQNIKMVNETCRALVKKPGDCPSTRRGSAGICVQACSSDSKCPGAQKCCSNGCGNTCVNPIQVSCPSLACNGTCPSGRYEKDSRGCATCKCTVKPGDCPSTGGSMGICVQACSSDSKCPGTQKCCSNGCGHTCVKPIEVSCGFLDCRGSCPSGRYEKDARGCATCRCMNATVSCGLLACRGSCPSGRYEKDSRGCATCRCIDPSITTTVLPCRIYSCAACPSRRYVKDSRGCETCRCIDLCRNITCLTGQVCKYQAVTCVKAPCYPQPMCKAEIPPPPAACRQPKQTGRCRAYIRRWYYNTSNKTCAEFVYGGCGANANNFQTQRDCQNTCLSACSIVRCELKCKYGFAKNARGCPECKCADPCKNYTSCQELPGHRCVAWPETCANPPCRGMATCAPPPPATCMAKKKKVPTATLR